MTTETPHYRILIVDDNPAIHDDFRKILNGACPANEAVTNLMAQVFGKAPSREVHAIFELESAMQGREALEKVERSVAEERPYSMAFVDVRMPPGWDGVETITRLWAVDPSIQMVICTAYSDFSWHEIVEKLGNSDRLVILKKPFDNIEVLQLAHAQSRRWLVTSQAACKLEDLEKMVRERTAALNEANRKLQSEVFDRATAQDALRRSEERFSKAFNTTPLPFAILSAREHRYVDVNPSFHLTLGFSREEIAGRCPQEIGLCLDAEHLAEIDRGCSVTAQATHFLTRSGEKRTCLLWLEPIDFGGESHILAIVHDTSERQLLEEQLRQAQSMDAVGTLAAGVAHDFNNILTVIQGHASLQISKRRLDAEIEASLRAIGEASARAAELTRQLLAFSRKQVMQPRVVRLDQIVNNISAMLQRLVGGSIEFVLTHDEALPCLRADVCNIEQVLLNLALNARDAMPAGGMLTLATSSVTFASDRDAAHPEGRAGNFALLRVSDTGVGMDAKLSAQIFQPFFTTKEFGKGTGMGLATVYGIVKQHDGWVAVKTTPGAGSTFEIFLPATEDTAPSIDFAAAPTDVKGEGATVLLVEDDAMVRELASEVLAHHGFTVIEACDGHAALAAWTLDSHRIDLLLTDMSMPGGMSGKDVAERLRESRPDLKVIYSSGYSAELFGEDFDTNYYLPKPYLSATLAETVHRAIQEPARLALA